MNRFSNVMLSAAIVVGAGACEATRICYAYSSEEVEQAVTSGKCGDVYVYDVTEEIVRFTNNEPLVYVFIDSANNPAVRRVEADGLGNVSTSGIDEVKRTNTSCAGAAASASSRRRRAPSSGFQQNRARQLDRWLRTPIGRKSRSKLMKAHSQQKS